MFTVISIMFAGVAVGYAARHISFLSKLNYSISGTIWALLFFLGIKVGKNENLMRNLPSLGGQALLLAVLGTVGSVLAGWAVWKLFFGQERPR